MKTIKKYTIPEIGEIEIIQKEKYYNPWFRPELPGSQEMNPNHFLIIGGCQTEREARIASEAYLRARCREKLYEKVKNNCMEGWLEQFQTYPIKLEETK